MCASIERSLTNSRPTCLHDVDNIAGGGERERERERVRAREKESEKEWVCVRERERERESERERDAVQMVRWQGGVGRDAEAVSRVPSTPPLLSKLGKYKTVTASSWSWFPDTYFQKVVLFSLDSGLERRWGKPGLPTPARKCLAQC